MKTSLDLVLSFIFLAGYCYTLTAAHFLLEKVNQKIPVPVHINETLQLREIRAWSQLQQNEKNADIKTSIFLLGLNNYLVYTYFALLICSFFFQALYPSTSLVF
jgi:hypothetical protein